MIFPVGLLAIAEDIAARIPNDEAYAAERNTCWLAIGKAHLMLDHFSDALEALNHLTDLEAQGDFRIAAALWAGEHPESDLGRDLLRDTVTHIEFWEDQVSRRGVTDLVKPASRILGTDAVQMMSWKLRDPFTASTVLVKLAGLLTDPGIRRETLRSAEEFAKRVGGDRDYALRWVVSGYKHAGLEEDELRARALMSQDLELMNEHEARILSEAEKYIQPLVPPEPDSPLLKLQRLIDYGYNDLRVLFLTECCEARGLNDPEAEQLVTDAAFERIAPPRPPSIYSDPSHFDVNTLARSLFGRAVCRRNSDRSSIDGAGSLTFGDLNNFIRTLRNLFERFGEIAPQFSPEQVDQGLWYLLCEPFWLQLSLREIPASEVTALIRAMYYPFRDYYLKVADRYPGSAFFMWWDSFSWGADASFDVLQQILVLPHKACRDSALHGLNHLFPNPRAVSIIDRYLEDNQKTMSKDEIDWVEVCKRGESQ